MYLDIHTHTFYEAEDTTILLNVFPHENEHIARPVYKSTGLHPWHITENSWESYVDIVEKSMSVDKVIAVGETGLDKAITTDYALQNEIFLKHLKIAENFRKPLIIHCVRSYSEMMAYRKKSDLSIPWIFHWFNADIQTAKELIRKNCYLSFGHMLFNEKSKAFRVFTEIPLESLFFETDDAGYTITEIYEKASFLRNISEGVLKKAVMANFVRCFQM